MISSTGYPVCLVEIHGEEESFVLEAAAYARGLPDGSPTGELLLCATEKRLAMDTPAGTFELQLARRRDARGRTWMDKLRPQATVVIQMMNYRSEGSREATALQTVMIGWIDTITETNVMTSRGVPERRIVVRGRDAGKLFSHGMTTYWNFLGAQLLGAAAYLDPSQFNAKPSLIMRRLLEEIFTRFLHTKVQVGAGQDKQVEVWDLLGYQLSSYEAEIPAGLDMRFIGGEGSFWSFFVKIASPPFHECFVDTRSTLDASWKLMEDEAREKKRPEILLGRDASPVLVLRPTPFPYLLPPPKVSTPDIGPIVAEESATFGASSKGQVLIHEAWDRLVRHLAGPDEALGEPLEITLSRSDAEQFNLYLILPNYPVLPETMFLLSAPPVLDQKRFFKYGYRPFMPSSDLIQPRESGTDSDPMIGFYSGLAWRAASWNVWNDQFLSGTATFRLSPHVHIGERLGDFSRWHDQPHDFYIEAVAHRFVAFERATTTLALTRGLPTRVYRDLTFQPTWGDLRALDPTAVSRVFRDSIAVKQAKD